jgi:hypothetical protein
MKSMEQSHSSEADSCRFSQKYYPTFYGTRTFITLLLRDRHWSVSSAKWILSTPFHTISSISISFQVHQRKFCAHFHLSHPHSQLPSFINQMFIEEWKQWSFSWLTSSSLLSLHTSSVKIFSCSQAPPISALLLTRDIMFDIFYLHIFI